MSNIKDITFRDSLKEKEAELYRKTFSAIYCFKKLPLQDRNRFILELLAECNEFDMSYLYGVLPNLHRNFLVLLPLNIRHRLMAFLSPKCFGILSVVSKEWLEIMRSEPLWLELFGLLGIPLVTGVNYWPLSIKKNAYRYYLLRNWRFANKKSYEHVVHEQPLFAVKLIYPFLITCSGERSIKIFRVDDPTALKSIALLQGHSEDVSCIEANMELIVSGSQDRTIKVWDFKEAKLKQTLQGHEKGINCIGHKHPLFIISGSSDNTVRIWKRIDKNNEFSLQRTLHGHQAAIKALDMDENVIYSCSVDQQFRIWHLNTGNCLTQMSLGYSGVSLMRYDSQRNTILFGTLDGQVHVMEVVDYPHSLSSDPFESMNQLQTWISKGQFVNSKMLIKVHNRWILDCKRDDWRLITASVDGKLKVMNHITSSELFEISVKNTAITSLDYDDRVLVFGMSNGSIQINYFT